MTRFGSCVRSTAREAVVSLSMREAVPTHARLTAAGEGGTRTASVYDNVGDPLPTEVDRALGGVTNLSCSKSSGTTRWGRLSDLNPAATSA